MAEEIKPRTSTLNGRLWGARARDWADVQEGVVRPVYEAVFERTRVGVGVRYLDVGCGSGMAARLAAERGARVSGIDAAEGLLAIARSRLLIPPMLEVARGKFRSDEMVEFQAVEPEPLRPTKQIRSPAATANVAPESSGITPKLRPMSCSSSSAASGRLAWTPEMAARRGFNRG
jgi:SAM-dependent methyltransferase